MDILQARIKEIEIELKNIDPLSAKWYRLQGELAGLYFAMGVMESDKTMGVMQCIK